MEEEFQLITTLFNWTMGTPDPTHSYDIMYNTTLSVNISAHNCAGYSEKQLINITYVQGKFFQSC